MEDSSADVYLIQEALSEHDVSHKLAVIKDGGSAIEYIDGIDAGNTSCPRLVILDLNLPRKSGREVLQRMRQSRRCVSVPVVILSSSGAEKDREETRALGATIYIKKPSDLAEFMLIGSKIKQLLEAPPKH